MKMAFGLLSLSLVGWSQDDRRHHLSVNVGAGLPRAELRPLFSASPLIGGSYGYRPFRYIQADAGFEAVIGAARIRDFLPTALGNLRIRDRQYFLPFGGRLVLPLANDRIEFYGGAGGVYLRYSESISQPLSQSGFRFDCDVCSARSGFGYYVTAGANVGIDSQNRFRIGGGARSIRGHTDGDPFGGVPGRRTRDEWVQAFGTFTIGF